jgi:predicted alpha/beta-fold hydrolase
MSFNVPPSAPDTRLDDAAKLISERLFEPHALLRVGALRRARTMDEERLFEVEPGVRLLARCRWQEDRISSSTLILVHGLGGSDASPYVMGTADVAYRAGMNVVRLNQRNCKTEHLTPTLYHSGLSSDLRGVVAELLDRDRLPAGLSA